MTGDRTIRLAESDVAGVTVALTDDQAQALARTNLVELRPDGAGRWRMLPTGRVGAVHVDGLEVHVEPKVGIARLVFLLGYASDPGFRPEEVTADAEAGLWPYLAESLIRHTHRATDPGVLQGYTTRDEALPLVRGRIRFTDQLRRRPGAPLPIEVRYDDYTADIPENRILRTALRRMRVVPRLGTGVQARLGHLDARLDGVHVLPAGVPIPAWRVSRLNSRYAPALRLAQLVLRHQSVETGPGGVSTAAFVVPMATVFEDFVTTALTETLASYPGHTVAQYRSHLDVGKTIVIRPDVVQIGRGAPAAVFDAKYKVDKPGYPNADAYQMLAYDVALGLRTGWLVYAQGSSPPGRRRIVGTDIDVVFYPLDLRADPQRILRQIADLASCAMDSKPDTWMHPL